MNTIKEAGLRVLLVTFVVLAIVPMASAVETVDSKKPIINGPNEYTFAVVPRHRPSVIYSRWVPLMEYIEKETGIKIKMTFADGIEKYEKALYAKQFDLAFTNPYHVYVMGRQGYTPLLRNGKKQLKGILVVRKSSGINSIAELDGQKISFPSRKAWGASVYLRALLKNEHKINFIPVYRKNHDHSYHMVVINQTVASGGVMRTFNAQSPRLKNDLKVLFTTPGTTPHAFISGQRVKSDLRERIIKAMLKYNEEHPRKMQKAIANPIRADYMRDYAPFANYKVEKILAEK